MAIKEPTCPQCGIMKSEWFGSRQKGYQKSGLLFCCKSCANDTGCECRSEGYAQIDPGLSKREEDNEVAYWTEIEKRGVRNQPTDNVKPVRSGVSYKVELHSGKKRNWASLATRRVKEPETLAVRQ